MFTKLKKVKVGNELNLYVCEIKYVKLINIKISKYKF